MKYEHACFITIMMAEAIASIWVGKVVSNGIRLGSDIAKLSTYSIMLTINGGIIAVVAFLYLLSIQEVKP